MFAICTDEDYLGHYDTLQEAIDDAVYCYGYTSFQIVEITKPVEYVVIDDVPVLASTVEA